MNIENIHPDKAQFDAVTALALSLLRKVTGLGEHVLRESTTFEEISLESLAITAFVSSLDVHFPGLSKTFIFDCRSILDVSAYLIKQHPDDVKKLVMPKQAGNVQAIDREDAKASAEDVEWPEITIPAGMPENSQRDAIAIIGMHGRFPGANSLDDFWENLHEGRDSVTEIPAERWPLNGFFEQGTDSRKTGLSYAKWGGFISEADKFDAQFFGISSREADQMDPQERIFLECAWHAMENAALFGERAENLKQGQNYKIGVFVGLTTNTYSLLTADHWRSGAIDIPAAVPWSTANRVSFALNLSGPSLAVDTACSSSLVGLHLACESIAKGECKAAIAGGVNLYFHPAKYIQLCQLQMLSPTGHCHTFGKDGDGFVPGEGVGAIVLKSLSAAKADGDRILGVIRGTSVNHCGRTNGYTVPNAQSQAQLIQTALAEFDLPPSSISYIEAHGTGTKLGDPIEFTALTETLAGKSSSTPCGIGSVKSNIGHLESAAGIAGVIKVLQQLEHQCITPSLGSSELNSALDMNGSRFFVPQTPTPWQADPQTGVRRAGVSSFGAGGTNGHVIIEEAPTENRHFQVDAALPLVFPVSAKSQEQLHEMLLNLLKFIESDEFTSQDSALYSLAYILQCGRKHHPFRFVTVAKTSDELAKNIARYLQDPSVNEEAAPALFISHIRPDEETDTHNPPKDVLDMAKLWSQGARVAWHEHWASAPPLINTPIYPFARERHWIALSPDVMTMPANANKVNSPDKSSPTFTFTGQEYFLRDHQIGGKPILPAAAYFNCFYTALKPYGLGEQLEFQNVTWSSPFRPDGIDTAAMICNLAQDKSDLTLEFTSPDKKKVYCRTHCAQEDVPTQLQSSLADIRARCKKQLDAHACYPLFDSLDMVYGPTFRCMQSAWLGENEALVEVHLRASSDENDDAVVLEPGMLDGIFQSSFIFSLAAAIPVENQFIPYNIKSMRVHRRPGNQVFVHVKQQPQQDSHWSVFDYAVYGPNGEPILEIDGFRFRNIPRSIEKGAAEKSVSTTNEHRMHLFQTAWIESVGANPNLPRTSRKTLIFDRTPDLYEAIRLGQPGLTSSLWLVVPGEQFLIGEGNIVELNYRQADHMDLLWRMFLAEGGLPEDIIFNLADRSSHDSLNVSWEKYAGLETSKDIIEIIRSACQSTPSPRFHTQIYYRYDENVYDDAIAGFLRSVHQEIPTITASVIGVSKSDGIIPAIQQELLEPNPAGVEEIKWENGKRFIRCLIPEDAQARGDFGRNLPVANDVIVITGGAGAIAQSLAESLAETSGIRLALIGRSAENASTQAFMARLRSKGASVRYWQSDCADREKLDDALTDIRRQFGPISGVLHCAGILKDAFFLRQDKADWDGILKAKVLGALWLDELTQHDPVKWFVLCSALAGVRGNIGQSTYGLANAWLNTFTEKRQAQVTKSQRQGTAMAIAWSLWDTDGGMRPPASIVERYARKGLLALTKEEGVEIFQNVLRRPGIIIIPIKGRTQAVEEFLNPRPDQSAVLPVSALEKVNGLPSDPNKTHAINTTSTTPVLPAAQTLSGSLEDTIIDYLAKHLSKVTSTPIGKINPEVSLEAFGLDSILVMELNDLLEKDFPQMSKTVLFEARNLRLLAKLLIEEHRSDAVRVAEKSSAHTRPTLPARPLSDDTSPVIKPPVPDKKTAPEENTLISPAKNTKGDNIAIIGIAGRYPGASDLNELWKHLSAGHDLITEIPNRWSMQEAELKAKPLYAKWGGFVEDFDCFDPLFFGISPRDAERMDPQERLFLQTAWHTVEDAGYTPESLCGMRENAAERRRVGVIVGVMYGEYQLYGAGDNPTSTLTNSSYASIANRVSYCLDLDGPSFAIDSMCSSSLTSISLACDQLRSGRCDAVIAGGVNLSIHPHKYRTLCELNFASTDGRCRSFGDGGDGYVPGEGVGAVLLKRLEDAEKDGDHIYAVIQGSDIGHGAKTSGYTVPNADAQSEVIRRAFDRSGVVPSRLTYVEAHGTGTGLGDPIEIRGMTKALGPQFTDNQRCPVGSIKSNIGHLESAAGIAALSKVLLQLQHDKLAPSIHSDTLNRNIDFSKTPFFVQRELSDWQREGNAPRVAAVSSFGAGGANAHIVIEEYVTNTEPVLAGTEHEVFMFSARSHQQLSKMVGNFISYLNREMILSPEGISQYVTRNKFTARDVAMTLKKGRRHLRSRLAISAKDFSQLHNALNRFLAICGNDNPKNHIAALGEQEIFYGDIEDAHDESISAESITGNARAWVNGIEQAEEKDISKWRKVPLPGYEFLRNRYWIVTDQPETERPETAKAGAVKPEAIKQEPVAEVEKAPAILTPSMIMDRVAEGVMSRDEARNYLLAMSKTGNASQKETAH